MKGRRRKPTILHHLQGTYNATDHRDRASEPVPEGELIAPPADLTAAQKAIWCHAIEHAPKGVLFNIDLEIFRAWVDTVDRRHQAQKFLEKNKAAASWLTSPAHRILDHTTMAMSRLAGDLGFSPAARPRLHAVRPPIETANPWTSFTVVDGGKP